MKYELHEVQALVFNTPEKAKSFLESYKDDIKDHHIQTVGNPTIVLFIWNIDDDEEEVQ